MMCHSCGFPLGSARYFLTGFVCVFFVASGITLKDSNLPRGMAKKSKSLLIPYFFYGFLCIAVLSLRFFYYNGIDLNYTIDKIQGLFYSRFCLYNSRYPDLYYSDDNIFFLKYGLEPFWFLTCMYFAFLWTYLYLSNKKLGGALIILYLFLSYIGSYLKILLPWSLDASFVASFFIIVGYYSKPYFLPHIKLETPNSGKNYTFLALGVAILFFIVIANVFRQGNFSLSDYGRYEIYGFVSFCVVGVIKTFILGVLMDKYESSIIVRFFSFLGKHSLRLMCIHIPVFIFLDTVSSGNYVLSFVGMFISLLISISIETIIKSTTNMPLLRYI